MSEIMRALCSLALFGLAGLLLYSIPSLRDIRRAQQRGFDLRAWFRGEKL